MDDQNKLYVNMKLILERNGYWHTDIAYAIDIGKNGCEKSYRIFANKIYSYDTSTGLVPSEIYFALGLASMVLTKRYETSPKYDIPPDWFASEEAKNRRDKIKISSEEISRRLS